MVSGSVDADAVKNGMMWAKVLKLGGEDCYQNTWNRWTIFAISRWIDKNEKSFNKSSNIAHDSEIHQTIKWTEETQKQVINRSCVQINE